MARFLSQTLIPRSQHLFRFSTLSSFRLLSLRPSSNKPEKAQLLEINLVDNAASEGGGGSEEAKFREGMSKLEDAVHMIMVMRSAPDWLPFVPGSSYWVPPPEKLPASSTYKVFELVKRFRDPITEEEALSLTTVRGWPSTAFFVEGKEGSPSVLVEENLGKKTKTVKNEEDA